MSQIANIMLSKKLQDQIRFWRKFGNSPRAEVPGVLLEQVHELLKHQQEQIKAMDKRLADLFERLPEDLAKEVAEEWLGLNALEGADDEA